MRRALSWRGLPVLRAKLEPHPQWVFTVLPETIHLLPTWVIRIPWKNSLSDTRVWKVIPESLNSELSTSEAIHSSICTFSHAHPRVMRKHETSVMPRVCQSEIVCESNTILESEKYSCRSKSNNSTGKSLYGSMSKCLIECFTVIWSQFIECLGMEPCLVSYIHCIVDDNDREYEAYHEFIAPGTVFDPHSSCKRNDKCRVCWWHTTTSKHIRDAKSSLQCMNESLQYNSKKKCWKWYQDSIWIQVCLELIKHNIGDYRDSRIV